MSTKRWGTITAAALEPREVPIDSSKARAAPAAPARSKSPGSGPPWATTASSELLPDGTVSSGRTGQGKSLTQVMSNNFVIVLFHDHE